MNESCCRCRQPCSCWCFHCHVVCEIGLELAISGRVGGQISGWQPAENLLRVWRVSVRVELCDDDAEEHANVKGKRSLSTTVLQESQQPWLVRFICAASVRITCVKKYCNALLISATLVLSTLIIIILIIIIEQIRLWWHKPKLRGDLTNVTVKVNENENSRSRITLPHGCVVTSRKLHEKSSVLSVPDSCSNNRESSVAVS